MPNVPRRSDEQVQLRGLPNVQFSPDAPAAAFGGGPAAQAASQAAAGLAGQTQDAFIQAARDADGIVVTDAAAKLTEEKVRIINAKKQLTGLAAMNATAEAQDEYEKFVQKLVAGDAKENRQPLNARQRFLVEQHSKKTWADIFSHTENHAASQQLVMRENADAAQQKSFVGDAALNATDPLKIEGASGVLAQVAAAHKDWLARNYNPGASDKDKKIFKEVAEARLKGNLGQVHEVVIRQLVAGHRDIQAEEYFKRHKKEMLGDTANQMAAIVEAASLRSAVDKNAQQIYGAVKSEARKTGLPADERKANAMVDKSGLSGKAKEDLKATVKSLFARDREAEAGYQSDLYTQALQQLSQKRSQNPLIPVAQAVDSTLLGAMDSKTRATLEDTGSKSGLDSAYTEFVAMGAEVGNLTPLQLDALRVKMSPAYRDAALSRWRTFKDAINDPSKRGKMESLVSADEMLKNRLAINGLTDLTQSASKMNDKQKVEFAAIQLTAQKLLEQWQLDHPGKRVTTDEKQALFDMAIKDKVFKRGRFYGTDSVFTEALAGPEKKRAVIPYEIAATDPQVSSMFDALIQSLRGTTTRAIAYGRRGFYNGLGARVGDPPERWSRAELLDNKVARSRLERAAGYMRVNRITNTEDSGVLRILSGNDD